MEAHLKLQKSMGMIAYRQKEGKERKKADERRELNDIFPTAMNLFVKGETKKKLHYCMHQGNSAMCFQC